jgi:hypothetical protein
MNRCMPTAFLLISLISYSAPRREPVCRIRSNAPSKGFRRIRPHVSVKSFLGELAPPWSAPFAHNVPYLVSLLIAERRPCCIERVSRSFSTAWT